MHGIEFIQDLAVILVVAGVVGWICQRLGLSVVVGFLAAGMVVGPYTPPFTLVSDVGRIETFAQVGLVFLMFSIGLRLSVRKLRILGMPLMLATCGGALMVYYLTRLLGAALGWSSTESLFLAGMLMVSSSAIISKILQETGENHERAGQLAMGISVLEDVVAIVMLTLLNSLVEIGGMGQHAVSLGRTLGLLGAFVALVGVGGLLLVPWLLRRMSIAADEELQTLGIAALLFGLAVVANYAGYSPALGAFLLGTIVAETPHRHQVERTFEGMRDIFTAVFFVAIGMQINVHEMLGSAGLIVGVAVFTLLVRCISSTTALTLIGVPPKDALRTGMAVTPIGEFSFIIAQLGVGAAVVPAKFYPLAVGVSLLTTLVTPMVVRRSSRMADGVIARKPRWLAEALGRYRDRLEHLQAQARRNRFWQLSRKRFIQIGVETLLVTGLLVFSGQLLAAAEGWLGHDWLFPDGLEIIFWVVLCMVLLAPLVAIWRNCSALALMCAQMSAPTQPHAARWVEAVIKSVAGTAMFFWVFALMPIEGNARWLLLASGLIAVVALALMWRKLVLWHSHLEIELSTVITSAEGKLSVSSAPWLQAHGDWNLHMIDCVLPDLADVQGKKIAELDMRAKFGCSIVGIERQGYMIPLPAPEEVLYPRDRVLLMGTTQQVRAGKQFLSTVSGMSDHLFQEVVMESLKVPPHSRVAGRTLAELKVAREHGVQIAGVNHRAGRTLNPAAEERLQEGDELLTLGTPAQIAAFRVWLRDATTDAAPQK